MGGRLLRRHFESAPDTSRVTLAAFLGNSVGVAVVNAMIEKGGKGHANRDRGALVEQGRTLVAHDRPPGIDLESRNP
jgi:hypothetical protein